MPTEIVKLVGGRLDGKELMYHRSDGDMPVIRYIPPADESGLRPRYTNLSPKIADGDIISTLTFDEDILLDGVDPAMQFTIRQSKG